MLHGGTVLRSSFPSVGSIVDAQTDAKCGRPEVSFGYLSLPCIILLASTEFVNFRHSLRHCALQLDGIVPVSIFLKRTLVTNTNTVVQVNKRDQNIFI
jgi:hypothetical protein